MSRLPVIARSRTGGRHCPHDPDLAVWIANELGPEIRQEILGHGTARARILIDRQFCLSRYACGLRRFFPCDVSFAVVVRQAILALESKAAA